MPFYDVWEKRTVYMVPARLSGPLPGVGGPVPPVDPGYSPPWVWTPVDPGYFPPSIGPGWPGGPVDPGYFPPGAGPGQPGGPVDSGYFPPGIGPGFPGGLVDSGYFPPEAGSGQSGSRMLIYVPSPPGYSPPSSLPTGPPDIASPYTTCWVSIDGVLKIGIIQTAINTSPNHTPKSPDKGLPGNWIAVGMLFGAVSIYAWIPTDTSPLSSGASQRPAHPM